MKRKVGPAKIILILVAIDPTLLHKYLTIFYLFFASKFPNKAPAKKSARCKAKFDFWLLVALAVLKEMTGFTWREFQRQIAKHAEILAEFQAKQVPSYGSIYAAW